MKSLYLLFICLTNLTLFSQDIELVGGINKNNFFDFNTDEGHYKSSYTSGLGYSVGIGIEDIKLDSLKLRFTLSLDKYSGQLNVSDGGLGGGNTTKAEIDKSVISLGFFPLNLKIMNRIDLNFGFEFSRLIHEFIKGTASGWSISNPSWSYDLSEKYTRYSSLTNFGLKGRIAYDISLSDILVISPQYSFYYGLLNEFDEFPKETKSMRQYICIGVQMKLN